MKDLEGKGDVDVESKVLAVEGIVSGKGKWVVRRASGHVGGAAVGY